MTTATLSRPGPLRLTEVELRKTVDTRAGSWLLLIIQLLAVGVVMLVLISAPADQQDFGDFFALTLLVTWFLLPVLGILTVTSEWSQRTGLTTFALVPQRGRVIGAKLAAALALTFVSVAVCLVCATIGTLISGGSWNTSLGEIGEGALVEALGMLGGVALGLVFLSSPLAIVIYFVVPAIWGLLEGVPALAKTIEWLSLENATGPLVDSEMGMTGTDWAQLATASGLWVGLLLLVGLWRLRRTELK
jgi:ABC-2 type transport system permease protein